MAIIDFGIFVIGHKRNNNSKSIAELSLAVIEPMLRKRGIPGIGFITSWPELVGNEMANKCLPTKIVWGKKPTNPTTVWLLTSPENIIDVQYQTTEIIASINRFLGYAAIDKIKIKRDDNFTPTLWQREVFSPAKLDLKKLRQLSHNAKNIENKQLKKAIITLGLAVTR